MLHRVVPRRCLALVLSTTSLLLLLMTDGSDARAILGVDLGSLYMKVALVQSGSPLEIVTNLHSKRKTEQMILFDREQRFYGADASSLLARKSQKTPAAMSVLLGRDDQHPVVQVLAERHYPLTPEYNDTRSGTTLKVDGVQFTPEELVAMVLSHAVDISVAYAAEQGSAMSAPPKDVVLTVPCYATQRERQALLDAAALADLNVLTLIDETTAAALQYAMDKTFADAEGKTSDDQIFLFYNMGASALQVSLVHFYSYEQPQKYGKPKRVPAVQVLAKTWDETLGGLAFDHLLVEHLADIFNQHWRSTRNDDTLDVRNHPRALMKLRLQANKVKHVLSANTDIPVHMDSLHDDLALQTHVSRATLEQLAEPLLARALQPVHDLLQLANKTLADVTGVELIGGGMRIPRVQAELSQLLLDGHPKLELGLHMNADESMALGAAFAGANISTAFRVRHVGLTDVTPFGMQVSLSDMDDATSSSSEWNKQATIFKPLGKLGVKKTIAFSHDKDVTCSLDYQSNNNNEQQQLPAGSEPGLAKYQISGVQEFAKEMNEKGLGKPKVALQFELSSSGIASLIKAEAAVEETYTVQEEIEVDDDDEEEAAVEEDETTAKEGDEKKAEEDKKEEEKKEEDADEEKKEDVENKEEGETKEEEEKKKPAAKPKKTVLQDVEKKRTHKRTLSVETTYVGRVQPHSEVIMQQSKNKLLEMAAKDKERMMLEESRNKVESYIYHIKNTINDKEEELATVSTEEQREECMKLALDAQEWMDDDGYSADYATMEDKYSSLSTPFEKIMLRLKEKDARPEAIKELNKKLTEVEGLLVKWETSKPQVTEEERNSVVEKIDQVRKWIDENEKAQAGKMPHEEPAYLSADVPGQIKPVETLVVRLSRKPKPPKKEKKEEEEASADNATEDSAADSAEEGAADKEDAKDEEAAAEGEETTEEENAEASTEEKEEETKEESKEAEDEL